LANCLVSGSGISLDIINVFSDSINRSNEESYNKCIYGLFSCIHCIFLICLLQSSTFSCCIRIQTLYPNLYSYCYGLWTSTRNRGKEENYQTKIFERLHNKMRMRYAAKSAEILEDYRQRSCPLASVQIRSTQSTHFACFRVFISNSSKAQKAKIC